MKEVYKFIIPLPPVTKKNNSCVYYNKSTGKPFICPSERYRQYEKDFILLCPKIPIIDYPINLKSIYYMPTKRKVDLINLHSALHDCLVKANVLLDDNCNIIESTDGSRVDYDKINPHTYIEITPV